MRLLRGSAALVLSLATTASGAAAASAREAEAASGAVVARARQLRLGDAPAWRRLLVHGGGDESQVDDQRFFLAAEGDDASPQDELEATLVGLFAPMRPGHEDDHVACRFPARRAWLARQLAATAPFPEVPCAKLDRFIADHGGEAIDVVYASNFLDDPTSAFGHIFLRLRRRANPSAANTDVVDVGVDFTAATDTRNPLVYSVKGFGGFFAGRFRFSSYDTMLREYATSDSRDVWEYQLTLSPDEVRMFVWHLWELENHRIDYLYVTENCSYRMIAAIDAAAPRLDLTSFGGASLPLDAVEAVMSQPGLVERIVYRPSVKSTLRAALRPVRDEDAHLVDSLLRRPDAPLPGYLTPSQQAELLDAAVRVLDARSARAMTQGQDPAGLATRRALARRRDAVAQRSGEAAEARGGMVAESPRPYDKAPHLGHGATRFLFGVGGSTQYGNVFATLGARLVLHDFADPPDGEPELTSLQLLDGRLRMDLDRGELTVDTMTFADLMTINPLGRWEDRLSWRLRFFGMRLHDDGCLDCFGHGMETAVGAALATDDLRYAMFLMANGHVAFADRLDGIDGSVVRAGLGPFAGVRARLPGDAVLYLTGVYSWLPGQDGGTTYDVRGSLRSGLAEDVALGIEASAQPRSMEAQLASFLYW